MRSKLFLLVAYMFTQLYLSNVIQLSLHYRHLFSKCCPSLYLSHDQCRPDKGTVEQ
uniref:Uncharacterized protein n=1 Tax=Manihot esculenta TaxID=3983 RepID=A0A2C9WK40_MANES